MSKKYTIPDMVAAMQEREHPTALMWNRLEGRPRTDDFDRALKAEVRDALWMLTKQWQMGEFKGDDAGSPVFAKINYATTRLNKYQVSGHNVQQFEYDVPLEAKVEQRPIPFSIGKQKIFLDIRLQMGRQWIKMVSAIGDFTQAYVNEYPIKMPDPDDVDGAYLYAHPEVWAQFAAVAGRAMDGAALYFYLKGDSERHAYDRIAVPVDKQDDVDRVAEKFIKWFESLYYQPQQPENNAWMPSYLEYQFACSAPEGDTEKVYRAEEYYHGRLDWYNLALAGQRGGLGEIAGLSLSDGQGDEIRSFIPTQILFDGMPNTRWWTFEDCRTNFGDIQPDTTDLAKLLLIEFGLIYANDWFLIPLALPTGTIVRVKGLALTNVFGERFWIEPSGSGLDDDWQRWSMFTINIKGDTDQQADVSLLMLPTMPKIQEGVPVEEAVLIRDEMANMVWGIETVVPLADGNSKSGREAAFETRNFYQGLLEKSISEGSVTVTPIEYKANIRYQVMNTVPENWIPFIPVHVPESIRKIQLQRAALPRIMDGDPELPEKIRPRTVLLREGLDKQPAQAYYVHEEEVPRAGIRVSQSFQRTRWYNGNVFVWLGVRKQTGKGEGHTGLAFDRIVSEV